MLNEDNFRKTVEDIINNPDTYTKEDIYDAFLDVTIHFLDEMVTTMSLENALTKGMGKESADELLEQIATTNPCVNDLDDTNAHELDKAEVIQNLFTYIEFELDNPSI